LIALIGEVTSTLGSVLTNTADPMSEIPKSSPSSESPQRGRRTGLWIAGGLALTGCLVVGIVDPNETQLLPACAFKAATGLDCPGCGMTRGLHALLRGDPVRALSHNVLLVTLLALSAIYVAWNFLSSRTGWRPFRLKFRRNTWIALGLVIGAFWVTRNLPWAPFGWLNSDA